MPRYRLLDDCRGLASLHVLLFHLMEPHVGYFGPVADWIIRNGRIGTTAFFVISGFGLAASAHRICAGLGSRREFLRRRLARIYTLHLFAFAFAAWIIPGTIRLLEKIKAGEVSTAFPPLSLGDVLGYVTLVRAFTSPAESLNQAFLPLNGAIWFIAVIVQVYLVVALVMRSVRVWRAAVVLLTVAALASHLPPVGAALPQGLFLPYWLNLVPGIALHHLVRRRHTPHGLSSPLLILLTGAVVGGIVYYLNGTGNVHREIIALGLATAFWLLHPLSERHHPGNLRQVLGVFGRSSYSTYLMHVPLWPLGEMVTRNAFGWLAPPVGVLFVTVPLVWGLSYLWHLFFERPGTLRNTAMALRHPGRTLAEGLLPGRSGKRR